MPREKMTSTATLLPPFHAARGGRIEEVFRTKTFLPRPASTERVAIEDRGMDKKITSKSKTDVHIKNDTPARRPGHGPTTTAPTYLSLLQTPDEVNNCHIKITKRLTLGLGIDLNHHGTIVGCDDCCNKKY